MKKLFLLTTKSLGDYYVIARDPNEADRLLTSKLDAADYGLYPGRLVLNIRLVSSSVTNPSYDKPFFTNDNRLIE